MELRIKLCLNFQKKEKFLYIDHVQPFLRLRCAYAPCHDVAYQAGGYDMSDWFAITKNQTLVNTNNPDASLILQVLDGRNPHLTNRGLLLGTQNQVGWYKKMDRRWRPS